MTVLDILAAPPGVSFMLGPLGAARRYRIARRPDSDPRLTARQRLVQLDDSPAAPLDLLTIGNASTVTVAPLYRGRHNGPRYRGTTPTIRVHIR